MHILGSELIKGKSAFGIPYVKMTGMDITVRLVARENMQVKGINSKY